MDISNMSVEQLQALGYRTKKELERQETNLKVIEEQIDIKLAQEANPAPKDDSSQEQIDHAGKPSEEQPEQLNGEPSADADDAGEKIEVKTGDQGGDVPQNDQ